MQAAPAGTHGHGKPQPLINPAFLPITCTTSIIMHNQHPRSQAVTRAAPSLCPSRPQPLITSSLASPCCPHHPHAQAVKEKAAVWLQAAAAARRKGAGTAVLLVVK